MELAPVIPAEDVFNALTKINVKSAEDFLKNLKIDWLYYICIDLGISFDDGDEDDDEESLTAKIMVELRKYH